MSEDLPQDVAAEHALLGTVMATAESDRDHAVKLLDDSPPPADFYRPADEQIATQLRVNAANGEPLDAIAIAAGLAARKIKGYGGAPYLHTLVSKATTPGSVTFYAARIRNAAQLRRALVSVNRARARLLNAEIDDTGEVRSALFESMAELEYETLPPELAGTRSSWRPVDLAPVLDGTYQRPVPTIGQRSDRTPILYPGKQHAVYSESEAGKTWFALLLALQEMNREHHVVYLDFEDDEGEIGNRLLTMGALPGRVLEYFHYVKPTEPITLANNADVLGQILTDIRPTMVVIDGITEAMAMHNYDPKDNIEVAHFNRAIPGRIADSGAASLVLDHVTKDKETRGRYALGGVHKLNALNGAAFMLENRTRFGIGITGRSGIYIAKDRPGMLRQKSQKVDRDHEWFGDVVVEPLDANVTDQVQCFISPPEITMRPQRPTVYMTRVSDALKRAGQPLTLRKITDRVTGRAELVRSAVAALIDEGFVREEPGPRGATNHVLIKPFSDDDRQELRTYD